MTSSMKAAIHLGSDFLTNSEIYKNTKNREILECIQHYSHCEEILNVECLEYSSPSFPEIPFPFPWTRSMLANDQAVKWAKAKVCVYADFGQVKDISGTTDIWKDQVEDLNKYSSYPDAVGLDGEPIEFEWKNFKGISSLSFLYEIQNDLETKEHQARRLQGTRSSSCQFSMTLYGKRIMKILFRMPKKSRITQ